MATTFPRRALSSLPRHSRSFFNFGSVPSPPRGANGTLTKQNGIYTYKEDKVMPFTPTQLHSVIADVDSYQSFLPFTSASRVLSAAHFSHPDGRREPQAAAGKGWLQGTEGDRWQMDAELRIGAMGFDEGYVSLVEMEVGKWVKATAKDASMFRHLSTLWSFTPLVPSTAATPQTKVDLNLAYQFTSPLHAAALSAVWDKVSALMVQKFEERVEVVHGRR